MKNNILLIGSSGFIGKKLKEKLSLKCNNLLKVTKKSFIDNLTTFSSNNSRLLSPSNLKKFNIIVNCAGEVNNDAFMINSNTTIIKKIIDNINHKCLIIHLSSCAVYGKSNFVKNLNFTEKNIIPNKNLESKYQSSKILAEKYIIKKSLINKNFSYIILRPSQVIDKNMPNDAIRKLRYYSNKFIFIYFGFQKTIKSYVSLLDLVKAVEFIIKYHKKKNLIYNISQNIYLTEIVECLKDLDKFSIKIRFPLLLLKFFVIVCNKIKKIRYFNIPLTSSILDGLSTNSRFDASLFLEHYPKFKFSNIYNEIKKIS